MKGNRHSKFKFWTELFVFAFHFTEILPKKSWISVLAPAMSKQKDRLGFFALVRQPSYENKNSKCKTSVLSFAELLGKYIRHV